MVGEEEEIGEVDGPAAVEVEAGVAAAEGLGKEKEVPETDRAVAVEVRRFQDGCVQPLDGCHTCALSRDQLQDLTPVSLEGNVVPHIQNLAVPVAHPDLVEPLDPGRVSTRDDRFEVP